MHRLAATVVLIGAIGVGQIPVADAMARSTPAAAARIAYGSAASQFGELWLPTGSGPASVAILIHGGCWQSAYGLDLMDPIAEDLWRGGIAVWNIEYRRLGEEGGGYPGTFLDVGTAVDALRRLPQRARLDLSRLVAIGHSAGGHLAMWSAARHRLPKASPLAVADPQPIGAVITLAGINDLAAYRVSGPACGGAATIDALTGARSRPSGTAFTDTSPPALLPIGARQLVASGDADGIVPVHFGRDYARLAAGSGDAVDELTLPGDHFALIDPSSAAWVKLRDKLLDLLK